MSDREHLISLRTSLEKELAQFEEASSDEDIVEKLKGLGYIS